MPLADWIMRAATSNPPRSREQWAHAMCAEFASLAGGKFSWALGCWTTMLGWRLREDAPYIIALLTATSVWEFSNLQLTLASLYAQYLPPALTRSELIQPFLAVMLLVSILLTAFRPDRALLTAVTMVVLNQIGTVYSYYDMRHVFPNSGDGPIHPYNSYYFVAVFAEIGVCFVGAQVGRWIAGVWRKQPAPVVDSRPAVSNT